MRLGFSTNSIGDVDPLDALPLLAELGYTSLAITLDRHTIDPFAADLPGRIDRWRKALAAVGMRCVIETGARHLLDPRVKHEPTFVTADPAARDRRIEFTRRAIDIAAELGADCTSMWSGVVRRAGRRGLGQARGCGRARAGSCREAGRRDRLRAGARHVHRHARPLRPAP
jgi:sugar phosphate isomerase/epimerase